MRELKFRVYIPDHEKLCYFNLTHFDYSDRYLSQHLYPVQQYTGLKDKNGVEIYEGDIVRIYNNTRILANNQRERDALHVVEWETNRFDFILINGEHMQGCGVFATPNYEIIGNIMETPELLKA